MQKIPENKLPFCGIIFAHLPVRKPCVCVFMCVCETIALQIHFDYMFPKSLILTPSQISTVNFQNNFSFVFNTASKCVLIESVVFMVQQN